MNQNSFMTIPSTLKKNCIPERSEWNIVNE
jgi:hypothetical protein